MSYPEYQTTDYTTRIFGTMRNAKIRIAQALRRHRQRLHMNAHYFNRMLRINADWHSVAEVEENPMLLSDQWINNARLSCLYEHNIRFMSHAQLHHDSVLRHRVLDDMSCAEDIFDNLVCESFPAGPDGRIDWSAPTLVPVKELRKDLKMLFFIEMHIRRQLDISYSEYIENFYSR